MPDLDLIKQVEQGVRDRCRRFARGRSLLLRRRDSSRLHGDVKAWQLCHEPPVEKTASPYLLRCNKTG